MKVLKGFFSTAVILPYFLDARSTRIYALFAHARFLKYAGVGRKDVSENNQIAQKARELMRKIPAAVLNNEVKFFLPRGRDRARMKFKNK